MRLPNLPYAGKKTKRSTIQWSGLNKKAFINDNELSSATNLSTKNFPLISPREPRESLHTLVSGTALSTGLQLAWVDGTDFKYNNVSKGVVTSSVKYMTGFDGNILIFPDKKYYDYETDTFGTFGTGTYPTTGSVPDINYSATMGNRVWGVKDDDIYASALGDYTDWTTFDGVNTDAYATDTGTNGAFTGIVSYKGTILAFKTDRAFKLFGSLPSNYQFIEISRLGCTNHKSIYEVNGVLFWLSPQGVCAYTGGVPELISENLEENYVSGVSGGDNRRYFLSLYDGTGYTLYTYDTWESVWLEEDNLDVDDFILLDSYVYALSGNIIYKLNSGTETVESEAITKQYTEEMNEKKGYSDLLFRADLEDNASLRIYVKVDNREFTLVKSYSSRGFSTFKTMIPIKRADHFQIKIVGSGEFKLYQMERRFHIGSTV